MIEKKIQKCVKKLNVKGEGIIIDEKIEIAIPYTLPGEMIECEKHNYRGKNNYVLNKILTKSEIRSIAPCKYFGVCGGCNLQHINDEVYKNFKRGIVNRLKNKLQKKNTIEISEVLFIPSGYRRRAKLECVKKEDKVFMGFLKHKSDKIVDINRCIALSKNLCNELETIREVICLVLKNREHAKVFIAEADNGIDVVIEKKIDSEVENNLPLDFLSNSRIIRICVNTDTIEKILYKKDSPYIILDGFEVEISAKNFLQSTSMSDKILYTKIIECITKERNSGCVVDLFCGRGTFSIPLSKYYKIDSFDVDSDAIKSLNAVAIRNKLNISAERRDLFNKFLTNSELKKYNIAIINPPRAGALAQIKVLKNSDISEIIYVSCNIESLERDLLELIKGGYRIIKICPVDQFAWTHHLEFVVLIQRAIMK